MSNIYLSCKSWNACLQLPDHVHNWLVCYLESRGLATQRGYIISTFTFINVPIVQGSGTEPASYVIVASDLRPSHSENRMNEVARTMPMCCLVLQWSTLCTEADEINNIQLWAAKNNLKNPPQQNQINHFLSYQRDSKSI